MQKWSCFMHTFISPSTLLYLEMLCLFDLRLQRVFELFLLARWCVTLNLKPSQRFSALCCIQLIVIVVSCRKSLISSLGSLSAPDWKALRDCVCAFYTSDTLLKYKSQWGCELFMPEPISKQPLVFSLRLTKLFSNHKLSQESCWMFFEKVISVLYEM